MKTKFTLSKLCKKTEDLGWSVREKLTCMREKHSSLAWTTEKIWNSSFEYKDDNREEKKGRIKAQRKNGGEK